MWNSTSNTNTESDNKKKEIVEGDGNGSYSTATFGAAVAKHINPNFSGSCDSGKQNSFNDFGNSKKDQHIEESQDSGFVSGNISSSIIDSAELQDQDISAPTTEKIPKLSSLNILGSSHLNSGKQQEFTALDSGCIVSEEFCDDEQVQVSANQQKQVTQESSIADESVATNPMIFKQKVDANISEWFCNLSLQSDPTQSTTSLNNLNNAARTSNPTTNQSQDQNQNQTQQQQAQCVASNKQQTQQQNTPTGTPLNPSNAWERFYQQNDDDGDTPLHAACAYGEVDIVAALIRMAPHPCLFNIRNDVGQTPLHIAARAKQPKILRMLLIAGAEPIVRDRRGNTPLHLACNGGEMQCVNAITMKITQSEINEAHRQYGHRSTDNTMSFLKFAQLPPDLEISNYDGKRCVHIATEKGHIEILRLLEFAGADMNAREGHCGFTPLHIAIQCNNEEIINFLLNECKNLKLEEMTYAGRTAYQIAYELEKYQMTNILKERGAEPLTPPDSDYDSSDLESDDEKEQDWFGDHFFANYTLMVA